MAVLNSCLRETGAEINMSALSSWQIIFLYQATFFNNACLTKQSLAVTAKLINWRPLCGWIKPTAECNFRRCLWLIPCGTGTSFLLTLKTTLNSLKMQQLN